MATIADVVTNLQNVGIFQFFLPFVILFAAMYGLLTKTQIFGKPKEDPGVNKINAIISFAASAFIMLYPTTSVAILDLSDFLANIFAGTLIYIVTIIVFLIVMFMIATPMNKGEAPSFAKAGTIGAIVAVVLVVALFLSSGGTQIFPGVNINLGYIFTGGGFGGFDPTTLALAIVFIIMALAVWWIVK